ncbi:MAG: aldo/keto reductase [Candidatus Anammoxibacter sp.]
MEYRILGESDLKISVIGFGSWGIGGYPFWQNEGEEESIKAIKKAYELGINFFDTAPVYGFGISEELIGKALKDVRKDVIIATKCGLRWSKEELGSIAKDATKKSIMEEVDLSLKRLQTDYIDLYQVHWPDEKTPIQEPIEAMLELQSAGKIRHIGVSNYSVSQLKESMEKGTVVSLQPMYNMVERDIEKELLPFCVENKVGIIAYSPLASGVLTGKYDEDTTFKDWRGKGIIGHFTDETFRSNIRKVKKISKIAEKLERTMGQLAINWAINQKGITTAIVGMKKANQIQENIEAVGREIPPQQQQEIEIILGS